MPKLVLARGTITATDELIIVLNQSDSEPSAVLIVWPAAASVASPTAFPDIAATTVRLVLRGSDNTRRDQSEAEAVNGADALAEARRAYAAQQARQAEVDQVAEQLAVQLAWFQANPDWLSRALAAKATIR